MKFQVDSLKFLDISLKCQDANLKLQYVNFKFKLFIWNFKLWICFSRWQDAILKLQTFDVKFQSYQSELSSCLFQEVNLLQVSISYFKMGARLISVIDVVTTSMNPYQPIPYHILSSVVFQSRILIYASSEYQLHLTWARLSKSMLFSNEHLVDVQMCNYVTKGPLYPRFPPVRFYDTFTTVKLTVSRIEWHVLGEKEMLDKPTVCNWLSAPDFQIFHFLWIYIYSRNKVKEISENHGTKEHQNRKLFNFYLFV